MTFQFLVAVAGLKTRDPFRIARDQPEQRGADVWPSLIVDLQQDGLRGLGEGAVRSYYEEDAEQATAAAREWLEAHKDQSLFELPASELASLGRQSRAAQCAVDLALHDIQSRRQEMPLWRFLAKRYRLEPQGLPPSTFTIGLDEIPEMVRKVREAEGYPILKIKLGRRDVSRTLREIRGATQAELKIDANTAWTVERTLQLLPVLEETGVTLLEQPLARNNYEGFRKLQGQSAIPVWADESCQTMMDLDSLGTSVAGINLKLSKCGGLYECVRLLKEARRKQMGAMIGCFIETSVGITAGAHIACFMDHADLDGATLLASDPFVGMTMPAGRIQLPAGVGLGVEPAPLPS